MQESYENTNYNILISKENPHPLSGKNPLQNTPNLQKNTVPSEQPPPTHEISGKSQEIDSQKANSTVPSTLAKSQSDKITENSLNLPGAQPDKKNLLDKKRKRRTRCSYSTKRKKKKKNPTLIQTLIDNAAQNSLNDNNTNSKIEQSGLISEFSSSSGAIKFDPDEQNDKENEKTAKKKLKITEKEIIANAQKDFMDKLNEEYPDEQFNRDLNINLQDEKTQFMQKNFPIMFRKDKYYLYNILLNKRRTQSIHFIHPKELSNSLQENKKMQTLYFYEEPEKIEFNSSENSEEEKNSKICKNQNIESNTEEEQLEQIKKNLSEKEPKNKQKKKKFIPKQKKNKKNSTGMSDTSPSEHDVKITENMQSIDDNEDKNKICGLKLKQKYDILPKHIWSMPENDKNLDVDLFYDDCIQIWPFNECTFVKEIALEFLMKNNYSIDNCIKRLKDFVIFMKKRAKELDISILNQNEKTVKNYSLRKIKNN